VHKLGWGYFSTVWLCWDSKDSKFCAVKLQKSAKQYTDAALDEITLLKQITEGDPKNEKCVVHLFDHFILRGPNGKHVCMVMEVMGENLLSLLKKYDYKGLPLDLVRVIAKDILTGLDYIHRELNIIHTDLKPENVLLCTPPKKIQEVMQNYKPPPKTGIPIEQRTDIENLSKKQKKKLRKRLQKKELQTPNGMKEEEKQKSSSTPSTPPSTIPKSPSTPPKSPKVEMKSPIPQDTFVQPLEKIEVELKEIHLSEDEVHVKLADFGNGCWTHKQFTDDIQTRQYRAPEVILGAKYSTPVDIWSCACLIFELVTGDYLFDPKPGKNYSRDEDHLAQIMELLGPMPSSVALKGKHASKYFTSKGELRKIKTLKFWGLASVLYEKYKLDKEEAESLSSFLIPMLQYVPGERLTAQQLLQHPWLKQRSGGKRANQYTDPITSEMIEMNRILQNIDLSDLSNVSSLLDEIEKFEVTLQQVKTRLRYQIHQKLINKK